MPLELQVRDIALLYYAWQNRYLAQRQVRQKLWPKASQAAVAKRLIELVDAKLLRTLRMPWRDDRVLYSVTLAGTRALNKAGFENVRPGDYPKQRQDFTPGMKHDLDLVDLRIGCEATGHIVWWTSEHELRLARRQGHPLTRITDGVFKFDGVAGETQGIFEYERMGYRRSRFHDILNRLMVTAEHQAGAVLFFVCVDARRAATLRAWAAESLPWRLTPKQIYFSHFEAVKEKGLLGDFVDLNGLPLQLPVLVDTP